MRTTTPQQATRQPLPRFPLLLGLVLALALGVAACSSTRANAGRPRSPGQGRLVDIGGRRLYLACQGTGTPVVVFVAGLGDSGEAAWRTVQDQTARSTRAAPTTEPGWPAATPPRPPPPTRPRPTSTRCCGQGRSPGPYLLVGHSLGGLLARLYAHDHPTEVAGVVLLDGTPVNWFPTVRRLLPKVFLGPLVRNPEVLDLAEGLASLAPLDAPGALGRRPLAVPWTANQPPPGLPASATQELGRRWEAEQARLGRLSAASRLQRVAAGGHYLQRDQPQLVVETIEQVLAAAQRAAAR
jgi:pimeloyl-ACP methyl ester carboxylesterase